MKTPPIVSAEVPDMSRERIQNFWDAGPKLIRAIRRYQAAKKKSGLVGWVTSKYWVASHHVWSLVCQCDIPLNTDIGGGLILMHANGVVIHPDSKIGPNCLIFHQVTLAGPITLGGHVDIGAGAKLLGPLNVGDHARIGANSVVTGDVDAGTTVAGMPARPIGNPK